VDLTNYNAFKVLGKFKLHILVFKAN